MRTVLRFAKNVLIHINEIAYFREKINRILLHPISAAQRGAMRRNFYYCLCRLTSAEPSNKHIRAYLLSPMTNPREHMLLESCLIDL